MPITRLSGTPADLWITVADPHRAGAEVSYWPGDVNFRACDAIVINKANTAPEVLQRKENCNHTFSILAIPRSSLLTRVDVRNLNVSRDSDFPPVRHL